MSGEDFKQAVARANELTRKYLRFTDDDVERVRNMGPGVLSRKQEVIDSVTESLLGDPEAREVVEKAGMSVERAKRLFDYWLTMVFNGDYGEEHALKIFKIGLAHLKSGVNERLMVSTMGAFMRELIPLAEDKEALTKALSWNLAIMIFSYEYVKTMVIKDSTGLGKEAFSRFITVLSQQIYEKLMNQLGGPVE